MPNSSQCELAINNDYVIISFTFLEVSSELSPSCPMDKSCSLEMKGSGQGEIC